MVLFLLPVNYHIAWILLESQQKAFAFFPVMFIVMMMIPCGMNKANADAGCFLMIYTESYQYSRITSASHWKRLSFSLLQSAFCLLTASRVGQFKNGLALGKDFLSVDCWGNQPFFPVKLPRNRNLWAQKPHNCTIYYYAKSEHKLS